MDGRRSRAMRHRDAREGDPVGDDGSATHDGTRIDPWEVLAPELFGGGLELVAMSPGAWRLCDGRVPRDDAASVIAYVERDGDGVDVVWLQGATGQAHFTCLQDVLAAADGLALPRRSAGPTRPVPIAHFAPRAG
jgi:hypothetical protein